MRHRLPEFRRTAASGLLACIALCGMTLVAPRFADAEPAAAAHNYVLPNFSMMVDILFANGIIDPSDPRQLVDYVRAKDCTLIDRYYGNDFAWNKIKNRIIMAAKSLQKDVPSRFVINDQLQLNRYNFKTQSFDIDESSQMRNVNTISLLGNASFTCNGQNVNYADSILPHSFKFRSDVPLSLYRLPMAEGMARRILPDIIDNQDEFDQKRVVYISMFLTVDGVAGISQDTASLAGHIDRIEFFSDAGRTQRIKTLLYNNF